MIETEIRYWTELFILKEDEAPTSIGGELQQFSLGGGPISFQDKASGGSQAWSVEECFAFDHAAARTPEAFLNICRWMIVVEYERRSV